MPRVSITLLLIVVGVALLGCAPPEDVTVYQNLLPAPISPATDSPLVSPDSIVNSTLPNASVADLAPTSPLMNPDRRALQPLVQAASIYTGDWSPDGTFLAYWRFSEEETAVAYMYPPGELHFLNAETRKICKHPWQVGYGYFGAGSGMWLPTGEFLILTDEKRVLATTPCAEEATELTDLFPGSVAGILAHTPTNSHLLLGSQDRNWLYLYEAATDHVHTLEAMTHESWPSYYALSPSGQHLAIAHSPGSGNPRLATTYLLEVASGSVIAETDWSIVERKGEFSPGIWLNEQVFLIPETIEQGPLILGREEGVTAVAKDLFELERISNLYARGAMVEGTNTYHLLLFGYGLEAEPLPLMLYHSEHGEFEQLPFQRPINWSPDGQWLTVLGHSREGEHQPGVWLRHVDGAQIGAHRLSESDSYYVAWHADSSQVTVGVAEQIRIFSVPAMTEQLYLLPPTFRVEGLIPAPNNQFVAVRSSAENTQVLFLIEYD